MVFHFGLNLPKKEPKHYPEKKRKDAQYSAVAPLYGDLSQRETLSEIKPPLAALCANL